MDTSDSDIVFDANGVCHHCHDYDRVMRQYVFSGAEGEQRWQDAVARIKGKGAGKRYDCIVGVSGGVDSSYVAWLVKQAGLRPLAVHLDNGWNTEVAVRNIESVIKTLGIDLHTEVLAWDEFRSLQVAFLRASVPDCDIPTDHAIVASLYQTALRERIRFIVTGGNFVTELMVPLAWSDGHRDWKYIKTINRRFGTQRLKTYPHYGFFDKTFYFHKIRRLELISPLNYLDYQRSAAIELLEQELGWVPYGSKHHESIYTRFYQGYLLPTKFGADKRRSHLSCLINQTRISRQQALLAMEEPALAAEVAQQDRRFVIKKLGLSEQEMQEIMEAPPRRFIDFPSDSKAAPLYYRAYRQVRKAAAFVRPRAADLCQRLAGRRQPR